MERLQGVDATFLYIETVRAPGSVGVIMEVDPPSSGDHRTGVELVEHLTRQLASRLHHMPVLRRRVRRVPGDLHHPVLVDDPHFDLSYHIRHAALPAPGDEEELTDLVCRILSRPFDHERPLWELYVIEGFRGDSVAHLFRTHHAVADGQAVKGIMAHLVDLEPDPPPDGDPEPWTPEPDPSTLRLLAQAGWDHARDPFATGRTMMKMVDDLRKSRGTVDPHRLAELGTAQAPPSPFNVHLTGARTLRLLSFDLAEVNDVRRRAGVTVNDLMLTLVGGGVHRHLVRRGADTSEPLVAFLPMALGDGGHGAGNSVTAIAVDIGSDEADPVRRLGKVASTATAAKDRTRGATRLPVILDLSALTGPAFAAAFERIGSVTGAGENLRFANLGVSNIGRIPGPLYVFGRQVRRMYPIGPLSNGVGLNITLLSYEDSVQLTTMADAAAVPDPGALVDDLLAEWEAIRAADWAAPA